MNAQVRTNVLELMDQAKRLADVRSWSDAADVCREALELAPNDKEIMGQLGWYLSRARRHDEAIEIFDNLVQRDPDMAKWPYMLGYQYYDQQQWRKAVQWFNRALEIWDSYLVVLYRKGYAHTELNETDLARQSFQKCIAVWRGLGDERQEREAKHYSDACFQLGKLLLASRQSRNAENTLAESVKYGPSDAHKHYNYGKALLKNSKASEALEQFRLADRIEPNKDYILVYVARAQTGLGQYQYAKSVLERIPAGRRKAYVWHEMGKLDLATNAPQQAIVSLVKATSLDPENHNQFYTLGQAYEACEQPAAAHKTYTRAIELRQRKYNRDFPEAQQRIVAIEQQAVESGIELQPDDEAISHPDGYIKTFKTDRGFGFVSRDQGSDIFFHISDVVNPDAIEIGASVQFCSVDSERGPRAIDVTVIQ
jgi:tetratricopeptide (TPR) repeat protein